MYDKGGKKTFLIKIDQYERNSCLPIIYLFYPFHHHKFTSHGKSHISQSLAEKGDQATEFWQRRCKCTLIKLIT